MAIFFYSISCPLVAVYNLFHHKHALDLRTSDNCLKIKNVTVHYFMEVIALPGATTWKRMQAVYDRTAFSNSQSSEPHSVVDQIFPRDQLSLSSMSPSIYAVQVARVLILKAPLSLYSLGEIQMSAILNGSNGLIHYENIKHVF